MTRLLILLCLASGAALVASHDPNRCFECECIREKTYTEEYKVQVPKKVCKGKACVEQLVYETRTRTVTREAEGVDVCMGPLYELNAVDKGADIVDCPGKCFIREDHEGNVQRGCSDNHPFQGINPRDHRCQKHGDDTICFCGTDLCNHAEV